MESNTMESNEKEKYPTPFGVSGLGGWLVLIQIGMYITIWQTIDSLSKGMQLINSENWKLLITETSVRYHALWEPLVSFKLLYSFLYLLFIAIILILFYQKKAILPRLMIILFSVATVYSFIELILTYQIPSVQQSENNIMIREFIRSLAFCAIWIPYFLKSERVENTFVR